MIAAAQPIARRPSIAAALVCAIGVASLVLVFVSGNALLGILPLAAAGVLWFTIAVPLRIPVLGLNLLALTLLVPQPNGVKTLFSEAGGFLLENLNTVTPVQALRFTGVDLCAGYFAVLLLWRRAHRTPHDRVTASPRALVMAGVVSLATIGVEWAWGVARGGDVRQTLWQIHVLAFVPLLFFLIQSVIRGVEDQVTLGRIVVAAAICKACLAVYVRKVVAPGLPHELPYATSHDDSMIFAVASVILMARLNERFDRRASVACAAFLPLLAAGMIANERRIVWVDIAFGMLAVAMVSRWTPFKLFITRVAVISIPFVALYFVIGWNSSSRLFAPVRTVHTMVSGDEDSSTGTRDIENFNLIWTLKDHPLLGTGFGHEYVEKVVGDDISKFFAQYRYIPHNSVLGFWAFCGFVGFTGIWMLLVLGVFFAARAYRHARSAETRAAAASCIATVLIVVLQAYGDMALVSWTSAFLLAPALALAGKLAVATGAWKVAPRPLPPHEAALAVVRAPRLEAVP